jgi:hypothetical protein
VRNALRAGREPQALQLAAQSGLRDVTSLTYLLFLARHPERRGRWLKRSEPDFAKNMREWTQIRDRIVGPSLAPRAWLRSASNPWSGETFEGETVEAVGVGFEILKSVISPMMAGDVHFTAPSGPVGVTWPGRPSSLTLNTVNADELIIDYVSKNLVGMEAVSVKLRCMIAYNGPEITASFPFDAEGKRSRFMSDSYVTINNPVSIETRPASARGKQLGCENTR